MKNYRTIWTHEVREADQVSRILLDDKKVALNWKIIILPVYLYHLFKFNKNLRFTRKNLLFTKRLAFEAAKNIRQGKEKAWEFRQIEIKTSEVLDKEKKGFYTEKIRRRQLSEIELLINHYGTLLSSEQATYPQIIKDKFPSKGLYLSYLSTLGKLEEDVIQAAITTMRKGTKKDRRQWFQNVKETTRNVRLAEADKIYSKEQ